MANEIPEDLLMGEIIPRLPAKSIGRFRSVSKTWKFLLSSPELVKSHLHHRIRLQPEKIIIIDLYDFTPHVVTLATQGDVSGSSREVQFPQLKGKVSQMLSCCNGLVLFKRGKLFSKFSLVVINPVTLRAKEVPLFPMPKMLREMRFGLGYSSTEDDYKIVILWDPREDPFSRSLSIFSLKTGSWKKSAKIPYLPCTYCPGVYVDGRLHWLACKGKGNTLVIAAFDLSTEKFEEVPFPTSFGCDQRKHPHFKLAEMGGCLALLYLYNKDIKVFFSRPIDVWIMEKLGDKMCWKKFNFPPNLMKDQIHCDYEVICRLGDEFVLSKSQGKFITYNCETRVWRNMYIDGLPKQAPGRILTFRESLVCPNVWG